MLAVFREKVRDQLEEGVVVNQEDFFGAQMVSAQIVGNLQVIKQLTDLDYDGLCAGMEA